MPESTGRMLSGQIPNLVEWRRGAGATRRVLLAALLLATAIVGVGAVVYSTGGTAYTWPYLMILPILVAAALFQVTGGVVAALAGGLVLGPFMPLEVSEGMTQSTPNWLLRMGVLVGIGAFAGLLFSIVARQMTRLQEYARVDPQTGLPSEYALEQALTQLMAAGENSRSDVRCYLLAVYINNYGSITTLLGPDNTTGLIRSVARELDGLAEGRGKIFQTGTDQLVLLLQTNRREVLRSAREAIAAAQGPHRIGGEQVYVDVHVGAAAYPFHEADEPVMLIRKVKAAMFLAREQDRAYATYDRSLDEAGQRQSTLLGKLRPAIENNRLELHYQPKLDMESGEVVGVEALVRWPRGDGSLTPPGEFIPPAEQSGLIHPLTRWVIEAALEQQALWRSRGIGLAVAVNISPRNFGDEEFLPFVRDVFHDYNLAPGDLELEITENALMRNPGQVARIVNELAELGIAFSIDDFGTGYSSLAYLEQLSVETLKIDQTFVRQIEGPGNAPIVRGSILLAHSLGLKVVAEGIETDAVADTLREMDCDVGQGYGFCRPQPAAKLEQWLADYRPLH